MFSDVASYMYLNGLSQTICLWLCKCGHDDYAQLYCNAMLAQDVKEKFDFCFKVNLKRCKFMKKRILITVKGLVTGLIRSVNLHVRM